MIKVNILTWLTVALLFVAGDASGEKGNISPKVVFLGTMPCTENLHGENVRLIKMCDGETKVAVEIEGLPPREPMPRDTAQEVAGILWQEWQNLKGQKGILLAHGGSAHTKREMNIWDLELKRIVEDGYKLFHSPSLGTNGISCDMCHPDASNTHPETYPKFQTQLKKVALLRDMINWCIENPLEGPKLAENDEKMKALEVYILLARKGKALEPGRH